MPTPAIVIHDPSTTPSAAAVMPDAERQRAQARRREHADDADLVAGVAVGAVLRARVGRRVAAAPVPHPAGDEAAEPGGHQQQRGARRVAADEPVDGADDE